MTGLIANAAVDLVVLDVPAESWTVRPRQIASVTDLATGDRRKSYAYAGAGLPLKKTKHEFVLEWRHLKDPDKGTLEELLSLPEPHTLILWRPEWRSWAGDGDRVEFTMPWGQATDALTPPMDLGIERFAPSVKVGLDGTELTYELKSEEDYAGGEPSSGEVWFKEGARVFKLETAPTPGAMVIARVVPIYAVLEAPDTESVFRNATHEPRRLTLLEQ